MIGTTLQLITQKLQDHLGNKWPSHDDKVILGPITQGNKAATIYNDNKIIVTVINVEKENTITGWSSPQKQPGGVGSGLIAPPVYINVLLLFSANFHNYYESLDILSETISFFKNNVVFTRDTLPSLPAAIDKLSMEIQDLTLEELNAIWSITGSNYLPSVIYKVRLFPFN